MPLLQTVGLRKRFGGLAAVDGVDFRVEPGEVVGLIGPNGAGKTTFVDLLTGVQAPTEGKILFNGSDITRLDASRRSRRGLARTFQVPRPFHGMSIINNVMVGALFGGESPSTDVASARSIALKSLERVGLGAVAERATGTLTTAGRKRLEIARCLATSPKLLFLDEPLGGLNPTEVKDSLALIRQLNESGVSIVFIEHIVPAVTSVSHRIFVLIHGKKLAEGAPAEILSDSEVRRAYLGDIAAAISAKSAKSGASSAEGGPA